MGLKGQVGDWQFFDPRFLELQEAERNYHKKLTNFVVPLREDATMSAEELEAERAEEQAEIDTAEALTEEEQAEKDNLSTTGFKDWNKRDYQAFIRGCEKYGRDDFEGIALEVGKAEEEVFWERYKEIDDWERQIRKIIEAEQQHAKNARLTNLIKDPVSKYRHPLQQLNITYPLQSRTKTYSEDEDRFLVCALARHGIGSDDVYDTIKREILDWPGFRFDWFIKSRTPLEISRRCLTLISLVQKEHAPEDAAADPARKGRGPRRNKEANGEAPNGTNGSRKREADSASEVGSVAPPPAKKP